MPPERFHEGAVFVTEILRGQQGHPTPDDREAGPLAEVDPEVELPDRRDWERPETAEAAVDAARAELQQANPSGDAPDGAATGRRSR